MLELYTFEVFCLLPGLNMFGCNDLGWWDNSHSLLPVTVAVYKLESCLNFYPLSMLHISHVDALKFSHIASRICAKQGIFQIIYLLCNMKMFKMSQMFADKDWLNNLYICVCNGLLCCWKKILKKLFMYWCEKIPKRNCYVKKMQNGALLKV